jgi:cytochrome P450
LIARFSGFNRIKFGKRFGFLDKGEDICGMMAGLEGATSIASYLGLYPWLQPLFYFISQHIGSASFEFLHKFIADGVNLAKSTKGPAEEDPDAPATMIGKLLNSQASSSQDLNDEQVGLAAIANIAAGSDTTQIGLSSILFFIYTNPHCLQKLREELVRYSVPDRPSFRETQSLPYLQATIKESMRMNPGVGLPLWRVVPKGGLVVDGQFFPEKVWLAFRFPRNLIYMS